MASSNGEQHADPARAGVDWSGWEAWRTSHEEILLANVSEIIGETVGDATGKLKQRVKALELQLATALGALDVLRGRGLPGALNFRDTYKTGAAYLAHDVVTRDSSTFVALKDNPGPCPGDGWQMLACGGKRGVAGPPGEKGDRGERGARGEDSTRIASWKIDRRRFTATPMMTDGTHGPNLELQEFFAEFQAETRP